IDACWGLRDDFSVSSMVRAVDKDIAARSWTLLLAPILAGTVAYWGAEQRGKLISDDPRVRRRARLVLVGSLLAPVLPYILLRTCNQFVVAYRAEQIAGDRPYCILVPDPKNDSPYYAQATSRSQLSYSAMSALYAFVSGSRGGFWSTNHGVLV